MLERPTNANINLSQSVASVADTFLHEELSPPEEATLWRSFQEEAANTQSNYNLGQIPGGLEFSSVVHEDRHKFEMEPAGVSIFATLIENLLARFEFDAQNIQVTLVHHENMSLTLSLQEIRYHTTSKVENSPASCKNDVPQGESRTLTLTGTSISSKDLSASPIATPSYLAPHSLLARDSDVSIPRNLSWSSDSSIDDDTQFAMSQSLASLPPQIRSPAGSISSSMYESAISTVPHIPQNTEITAVLPESSLDKAQVLKKPLKATDALFPSQQILSLGSQPITLRVTTPPPSVQAEDNPFESTADLAYSDGTQIRVDLSIGIVPCALRPQQVWNLMYLAQAISPSQDGRMEVSHAQLPTLSKLPPLKLDAQIRGIVLLLLPFSADKDINSSHLIQFFNHPIVPVTLNCGYTRLSLESLSTTLSISDAHSMEGSSIQQDSIISFDFSLAEVSVFTINSVSEPRRGGTTAGVLALPLLVTDPHLVSQYSGTHSHPGSTEIYANLPTFDIIDWKAKKVQAFGIKVSQWRSQPPKFSTPNRIKPSNQANVSHFSSNLSQPAVRIIGNRIITPTQDESPSDVGFGSAEVQIAPLNIRLDLEYVLQSGGPVSFFEDVLALQSRSGSDQDSISSGRTVEERQTLPRSWIMGNSNLQSDPNLGYERSDPELRHIVSG